MASPPLRSGDVIADKYVIDAPIGAGGFSHVFSAQHEAMERTVAIKIFDPQQHGSQDPSRTAGRARRFEQEARVVSQLEHPNTVTIFDFGIENHRAYLIMEFIDGQTLKERIHQQGPIDPDEAVHIILQVLASLEEAHHNQILHRDLKPANIMLTDNFKGEQVVKVLDFGIAQALTADTDDDGEPVFLGTPRYAAPEQIFMSDLTLATDLYAVGALLWYALSGEPMVPTADIKRCAAIAKLDPPWRFPDDIDIGHGLRRVIEKAVAKDPSRRYQSAPEFAQALQQATSVGLDDLPVFDDLDDARGLNQNATIVDPNVVDSQGDDENIFLNPDASSPPPTPYAALRQSDPSRLPPSHRDPAASKPPRPSPNPTPIPLDAPAPPSSQSPEPQSMPSSDSSFSTAKPDRRPIETDAEPSPGNISKVAIALSIGAIALAAVVGLLLWGPASTDETGETGEPADVDDAHLAEVPDSDADDDAPSLADSSRFSVDGLLIALRSAGWRISSPGEPRNLPNYDHRATVAELHGERIDLNIYEVHDEETHQSLRRNIEFPQRYLIFDHIFLHIQPRSSDAQFQTRELYNTLRDFRDEVEASQSP